MRTREAPRNSAAKHHGTYRVYWRHDLRTDVVPGTRWCRLVPGSGTVLNGIHDTSCDSGKDLLTNITWRPHGRCSTNDLCHISRSQIIAAENPRPLQHSRRACLCLTQTHEPLYFLLFSTPNRQTWGYPPRYCTHTGPQMTNIRR